MTRRKPAPDPAARRRTALHEAGHAVAFVTLGIPLEYASIRPGRSFNAVVVPTHREMPDLDAFGVGLLVEQPSALRAELERDVIATLAGDLAGSIWLPRRRRPAIARTPMRSPVAPSRCSARVPPIS